jgi:molybdate transport system ATP-binding protein
MIEVAIRKRFGTFLLDAAFAAPTPGVTALFGPSGAGKTSIVSAIAGLLVPDEGRIQVDGTVLCDRSVGTNLPPERRRVGYVFQEARLFPHLSVEGNLRYGLRRAFPGEHWVEFPTVVALLGLEPLLGRRPATLSGGERQRVAIGRALLSQPRLLLMDEPLSSIDVALKEEVLPFIERLRDEIRAPVVYVSHALDEVVRIADTLVLVEGGRVTAAGPLAELMARPDLARLSDRDDSGSVLDTTVAGHDPNRGLTRLAFDGGALLVPLLEVPVGGRARVKVPARDVIVAIRPVEGLSVRNVLPGTVTQAVPLPDHHVNLTIRVGGVVLLARVTKDAAERLGLAPGSAVQAMIKSVAVDVPGRGRPRATAT